jgi:hypothetical protein
MRLGSLFGLTRRYYIIALVYTDFADLHVRCSESLANSERQLSPLGGATCRNAHAL